MTPFERRVAKLEAAKRAKRVIPRVLFVGMSETRAEARARFDAAYDPPSGHALLVVPAKPKNREQEAAYEARFRAQQSQLVAEARRDRIAVVKAAPTPEATPKRWPASPSMRPNGPHIVWRPQGL